jgi:hypothetical protein
MPAHVLHIRKVCVVSKILDTVIGWLAVVMAHLKPGRAWTDEHRRDKLMDIAAITLAKVHVLVPLAP